VDVGHVDSVVRTRSLEAVIFSQIVLEILPHLSDDGVCEELLDEGSIVVGEDIPEDQDAFLAECVVKLAASGHVELVLLL
jgi:hypothetical protein